LIVIPAKWRLSFRRNAGIQTLCWMEEQDRAKEALTELFQEAKNKNTHIIVERIVGDIDDIVKKVRFDGWQATTQGERLVQKELRRTLLKYKLHTDQELFDKAYEYIRQYY
jgi:type I restriction enzyme R subunit